MADLVRWNPAREMMTLRSEMDRLFDDFFGAPAPRMQGTMNWGIPLDVCEEQDKYTIEAVVPGMNPEEIDISIADNVLTISGQTQSSQEQQGDNKQYHMRERRFGSFSRTITLPQGINAEQVQANYANGILKIEVPKAENAKPRRITVGHHNGGQQQIDSHATSAKDQTMNRQASGGRMANNETGGQSMSTGQNGGGQNQGNQQKQR